jgi:rubrerythrin
LKPSPYYPSRAIGEAAYRSAVQSGGKNQNKLTPGWELLGLDKETATLIYVEEGGRGFKTDLESMYGNQNQQYNKKGQKVDASGKLVDEKDIAEAKASGDDVSAEDDPNNIYECGNCGFTIFIAQGRESKFYGAGFACPECGATKDQFKGRIIEEE